MYHKSGKRRRKPKRSGPKVVDRPVEFTARIESLGRHCDGVALADLDAGPERLYVPFALPGERVRLRTATGSRAEVVEILEPSLHRVQPFCQYYGKCGGCTAQHLDGNFYSTWKKTIVETALANKELDVTVDDLVDAHGDGRRRVTFHAILTKNRVKIGFMQPRSRQLTEIDDCPILAPALRQAPQIARCLAEPFKTTQRALDLALTATPEGLDCDIQGVEGVTYDIHVALAEQADKWELARLTLDGVTELERRKPMLVIGTSRVPLPAAGFLQATQQGDAILGGRVVAELAGASKVADLFCGIGPNALRLAGQATVYAADSNETAIAALQAALRQSSGLKEVTAEVRDLFRNPLYRDDLAAFDGVVLNPARAGAEAQSEEIARSDVPLVVYVSCDPATLARDAAILVGGGYELLRVTPVDQFKYASHIEVVAVFRKP